MIPHSIAALLIINSLSNDIDRDEEVVIFPTACISSDSGQIVIPVHAWIFEPEEDSIQRRALLTRLASTLGLEEDLGENEMFRRRAALFLVDNERNQRIPVEIDGQQRILPLSGSNGHTKSSIRITPASVSSGEQEPAAPELIDHWVTIRAVVPEGDTREFLGSAQVLQPTGWSVISDIDDTIKISEVHDRSALLRRTFLEEFEPVPGMADLYDSWRESGAAFHYVSSSPWQLYPALEDFRHAHRFPRGSMDLKDFRLKDRSFFSLFQSPEENKRPIIEELLRRFPDRSFVLVGDSAEKDPEIYARFARTHPSQVRLVLIRETRETVDATRFESVFANVPRDRWMVFRSASEISDLRTWMD